MFSIPFDIEKSIVIQKSAAEVYQYIADFGNWRTWSPWLCQEPNCPVTIEGRSGQVEHSQSWNGSFIGSGTMKLAEATPNKTLKYDLHFLTPWKSHSKVAFEFSETGGGTEVRWIMNGTIPIFLFFLKKMMKVFVGNDYDRGLSMLKEYLETGSLVTTTEVSGSVDRPALYYAGVHRKCSMQEISENMKADFDSLPSVLGEDKLKEAKHVVSIYHKFDPVGGSCEYTAGVLLDKPQDEKVGTKTGFIPAHKALKVTHTGPYRHLGNAWAAAMGCARAQYKQNKSLSEYEIYVNSPTETPENDLKTEVYVPVK